MGLFELLFLIGIITGLVGLPLLFKFRKKGLNDAASIIVWSGIGIFLISLAIGGFQGMPLGAFAGGVFCIGIMILLVSLFIKKQ